MPVLTPADGQLTATWNAMAGATRYEVYGGTDKDNPPQSPFAGDGDNTDTRCVITGLTNDITYYVWVKAGNSNGTSNFSPSAHATPQTQAPPAAPADIAAAVSSTGVVLTWTDGSGNESGFKIERGTNGTTFSQVGTVAANATSFPDSGLTSNTLYYYRVRAYNGAGDSAYSETVQAATYAILDDIQDMVETMINSLAVQTAQRLHDRPAQPETDPHHRGLAEACTRTLRRELPKHGIDTRGLLLQLEPGRALHGNARIHLTTVKSIKHITAPIKWNIVVVDTTELARDIMPEHLSRKDFDPLVG